MTNATNSKTQTHLYHYGMAYVAVPCSPHEQKVVQPSAGLDITGTGRGAGSPVMATLCDLHFPVQITPGFDDPVTGNWVPGKTGPGDKSETLVGLWVCNGRVV